MQPLLVNVSFSSKGGTGTDGFPVRGWYEENGGWYYLDPDTCLMCIGWKVIDREYYYFV